MNNIIKREEKIRVAVFASFDKHGIIHDYVLSYIKKLKVFCDKIIFIADNEVNTKEQQKINKHVDFCLFKRHGEYDFGSYKIGFNYLKKQEYFTSINEIIFCNDSCFCIGSFNQCFKTMDAWNGDFWGMTYNNYGTHVQSFFWVLRKNVFTSSFFHNWINSITKKESFIDIVLSYEVPFTSLLEYHGYTISSFIPPADLPHQHPLITLRKGDPLVKRKSFVPAKFNLWDICLDNLFILFREIKTKYPNDFKEIIQYYSHNWCYLWLRVSASKLFMKLLRLMFSEKECKNYKTIKFFKIPVYYKKREDKMPKISIIIPVYNVENYLKRCLDSIVNQTLQDIEIICVNDGSTDGSQKILEKYRSMDYRIKIVIQENEGLSAARNAGLKIARGEYIGFVDSDDWIDLDFYDVLYKNAKANNAEIAVAATNFISDKLIFRSEHDGIFSNFLSVLEILKNGSVWDKIFSRKLIEKNNCIFPKGLYFEDNVFLIKTMYYAKKIIFTSQTGYYYFQNPNGICRNKSQKNIEKQNRDANIVANKLREFAKKSRMSKEEQLALDKFISISIPEKQTSHKNFNFIIPLFSLKKNNAGFAIHVLYLPLFKIRIKQKYAVKQKKISLLGLPILKIRKNKERFFKKIYFLGIPIYYSKNS